MNASGEVERGAQVQASELARRISAMVGLFKSRIEAASVAEMSTDQLARYEKGSTPAFPPLIKLARAKGVRMEWLATGEEPMLAADAQKMAPSSGSHDARLDLGRLAEALTLIDQALVLTRRTASIEARARLAAMAYDVLQEEDTVAGALRRIMEAVETETGGS